MNWPKLPGRSGAAHAVLFDMDGVLTLNSPFHASAWRSFAREHLSIELDENDLRIYGGRNVEILTALIGKTPEGAALAAFEKAKEEHYRELARGHLSPMPGLIDYLDRLYTNNVPCALVTGADTVNIDFVLGELGLRDRFPVCIGAADVKHGKPDPEAYLLAATRLSIDPRHCLIHEDAPAGVLSGVSAGCAVVAHTTTVPAAALEAAGAAICVADFIAWMTLVDGAA